MSSGIFGPERWRRIEPILDAVLGLSREKQQAYLDRVCGDDEALRADVEGLLATEGEVASQHPSVDEDRTQVQEGTALYRGSKLGPYKIAGQIGAGGMGVVYKAIDGRLQRAVAIKVLPVATDLDSAAKTRFLREARAASSLDHANICTVHDIGESDDGKLYIVMAHYQGQNLRQRLRQGPLPFDEIRRLIIEVASGLRHAHGGGIVHRDIKPANIMLTASGQVKILDFGVAKIQGVGGLTRTGGTPGTVAYMAPEQIRGETVDQRADIWSLGVVLYEMLAGERPFRGDHEAAVIHGIVSQATPTLAGGEREVPEDLQKVVERTLAKAPGERYASVDELLADLGADPSSKTAATQRVSARPRSRWRIVALLGVVLAALFIGIDTWQSRETDGGAKAESSASRPALGRVALAVMQFRNLTGDPALEWLGDGLTEMLVAELSQSPEIEVLSRSRLHDALRELGASDSLRTSADLIQQVAAKVGVSKVILGSVARFGNTYRLTYEIHDDQGQSTSGRPAGGEGEASLLSLIDEISAAIRSHLEASRPGDSPPTIQAASTASMEAWKLYSASMALSRQDRWNEAIEQLERAIEIDPEFALALTSLATFHGNMGHATEAADYSQRAFDLRDRLPLDRQYQVEASYYGTRWGTTGRAIAAFEEGLTTYSRRPWRNNLARRYAYLERYEEAADIFDALLAAGTNNSTTYSDAAMAHAALGDFATGYRILDEFSRASPGRWYPQLILSWHLTEWGRLDEAAQALGQALEHGPDQIFNLYGQWRLRTLQGDYEAAAEAAWALAESDDTFARWRGAVSQARNFLYHGNSEEALRWMEAALGAYEPAGAFTALAHCWRAEILLARGDFRGALKDAERGIELGVDEWPEMLGRFLAALAQARLGNSSLAEDRLAQIEALERSRPNKVERRLVLHLRGLLALERGDAPSAVAELEQAVALLPPRGVEFHWHVYPDHVPLWYALGRAYAAADRPEDALRLFERAADSGAEHLERPTEYVRSLYAAASALAGAGRDAEAAEYYRRFVELWRDGDLDRPHLTAALRASDSSV